MQGTQRTRQPTRAVHPAAPAVPLDATRQDRFLRQLVPSSWEVLDDSEPSAASWPDAAVDPVGEDSSDSSASHDRESEHDGDESPEQSPEQPAPPADAPLQQPLPWQPTRLFSPAGGPSADERGSRDGTPTITAASASSGDGDAPWLGDIVQQITQLTQGGDARFQCWSVTLPLDPQALPDCELRLSLSPGTMTLRFRTGSAQSAAVVSRHRDSLRARLEALPSSPPAIDIDIE